MDTTQDILKKKIVSYVKKQWFSKIEYVKFLDYNRSVMLTHHTVSCCKNNCDVFFCNRNKFAIINQSQNLNVESNKVIDHVNNCNIFDCHYCVLRRCIIHPRQSQKAIIELFAMPHDSDNKINKTFMNTLNMCMLIHSHLTGIPLSFHNDQQKIIMNIMIALIDHHMHCLGLSCKICKYMNNITLKHPSLVTHISQCKDVECKYCMMRNLLKNGDKCVEYICKLLTIEGRCIDTKELAMLEDCIIMSRFVHTK